ncbi:MAG: GMC family oxidoreductase N-terminal domain-containing protein, partial [Pseudomonadota bacterium]|nr:GMC family oxidoreductase N-terminal domain-containing protein [Pseudomonadota bacterium]
PLCDAFIQACLDHGIPLNEDYNGHTQEGVSYVQRSAQRRRRVSTARAFLHPVKHRRNLHVITDAQATRILIEDRRATGIVYHRGGRGGPEVTLGAAREVIVSSGAINSPQLLQLSGIGDSQALADKGIDCIHHLPGVGANLRDHFAPRLSARARNVTSIKDCRAAGRWSRRSANTRSAGTRSCRSDRPMSIASGTRTRRSGTTICR